MPLLPFEQQSLEIIDRTKLYIKTRGATGSEDWILNDLDKLRSYVNYHGVMMRWNETYTKIGSYASLAFARSIVGGFKRAFVSMIPRSFSTWFRQWIYLNVETAFERKINEMSYLRKQVRELQEKINELEERRIT